MNSLPPVNLNLPSIFKFLEEPARHKAMHGGRGGGKSHSIATSLINRGYQRPLRWLCAREIQRSIRTSVKQLLEDKIRAAKLGPRSEGGNGYYKMLQDRIIGGDGRTVFHFTGLKTNPETLASMEGLDGVWIEEASNVSNTSIELLTPTIRKDGCEVWWSWNRRNITDPVDNMFLGKGELPPRTIVKRITYADNPWFPETLREEMEWCKRRDYAKYLHIWEGHPVTRNEAKVFTNWKVDDIDDQVPENCVPRLGADWGFSVDPTVLVECYVFDRVLYFRREAYKVRCTIDETPSLFAGTDTKDPPRWENLFNHLGFQTVRDGFKIVADSARPETIRYMADRKFNIVRAKKGAGSIEEGIEFIKSYDVVIHPDCVHVADEFSLYSHKIDPVTDEVLPILADKNNHTIDACRYALEAIRKKQKKTALTGGIPIPLP